MSFKLDNWPVKKAPLDKAPQTKAEYLPPRGINSHLGKTSKVEEFEDAYTIATRAERTLQESGADMNNEVFVDKSGRVIPWHELNGETEILANRDKRAIVKEEKQNKLLAEEGDAEFDNSPTKVELKTEAKRQIIDYDPSSSVTKFGSKVSEHRIHQKNKFGFAIDNSGKKTNNPGLYKSYNSKLNAGSPGKRLEDRRRDKKEHEEMNWQQ
jgi:hypothetical protein